MSDLLVTIGEELERRNPDKDVFFWMNWVMENPKLVPDDIKDTYGRDLFK